MIQRLWTGFRKKYIGDKGFYKAVLAIVVPIIIQNGISSFVNMLDNIMVGQIGTEQMSGVSIINQLYFVFMLCIFGGLGGVGIFTAQYFGAGNHEGVQRTFRAKLWVGLALTALGAAVFLVFGRTLIGFFLHEDGSGIDLESTLGYAELYLHLLLISFPAFFILQVYTSMLRECGETVLPMKAGLVAVCVNLVGNFLLIYGHFGLPKLGVAGAAIATVLSRYVEMLIVVIWTHTHGKRLPWVRGLYRTLFLPLREFGMYLKKGLPLLFNETLWSAGQAVLAQCYSTRGLAIVGGLNIANTLNNVLDIIFITLANSILIVVGQLLGAGRLEEAKDKDNKMIFFSIAVSVLSGLLLVIGAFTFPYAYKTTDEVRRVARDFILAYALVCPKNSFLNAAYFTLRAGGKTIRTFIFDSGSVWLVSIPIAFVLSRFTNISAVWIFLWVAIADLSKVVLGVVWVKKNIWLNNLVAGRDDGQ